MEKWNGRMERKGGSVEWGSGYYGGGFKGAGSDLNLLQIRFFCINCKVKLGKIVVSVYLL